MHQDEYGSPHMQPLERDSAPRVARSEDEGQGGGLGGPVVLALCLATAAVLLGAMIAQALHGEPLPETGQARELPGVFLEPPPEFEWVGIDGGRVRVSGGWIKGRENWRKGGSR